MTRLSRALAVLVVLVSNACTQDAATPPVRQAEPPASVTLLVESTNRDPARFSLSVDSSGNANYMAEDTPSPEGGEAAGVYQAAFEVSPATRNRVFALAQGLDYFHGDFEFRKHVIADTGRRTFTYRDITKQGKTVFHWSENKQMQELTDLFESIALTQTFARRLVYLRRFDKLGIDAALKRMEELAHLNMLSEIQAIAPTLRQIAADPNVMHVARERAQRMLERSTPASTTPSAVTVPPDKP